MLVRLSRDRANIALPALELLIVFAVVAAETGPGALAGLVALMTTGLFGWMRSVQHARLILDTPTSRIASAAQGYTELRGRGRPLGGMPLLSPVNGLPVLWYRLTFESQDSDGKWRTESTEESDASFLLDDGSGLCAVDPVGAQMLVGRRDVFDRGDLRLTQWSLIANDPVYVLGDFATLGSIAPELDTAGQVRDLLAQWKADRSELLARFDLDGNGEIDLREWELARAQAKREVAKRRHEVLSAPETHVMRRSQGRLYLISDLAPSRIARRYRLWAGFHLTVFLGAAAGTAWFHQIGVF